MAGGGNVVIPTFAVERAQELMYHISRLTEARRIPRVPVFLDSPMAVEATAIFDRHRECYDEETRQLIESGRQPLRFPGLRLVADGPGVEGDQRPAPPGDHHGLLGHVYPRPDQAPPGPQHHAGPNRTILFAGYQARGTLGRQILDGDRQVRIHGRDWQVRARVEELQGLSGHADRAALLRWLGAFTTPPKQLFLTHGEPESSLAFAEELRKSLGWQISVPEYQDVVEFERRGLM